MGSFVTPTYLGDFSYGQTVYFSWNSLNSSGASVAPTGTPTVRVYKNGSTTEDTSTGTSSFSFDSKTGINYVTVTLNSSFFVPGSDYFIVLDSLTLDSQTVSMVVAQFSMENRTSIAPMLRGLAAAASSSTLTLDSNAVATSSMYTGNMLRIVSGTGAGQSRIIYSYTSGRIASVTPNWTTTPDTTSYYQVLPLGSNNLVTINSASSISAASVVNANMTQIDGNATNGNNATLYLKQLNVVNSAGSAIIASSTGSNGDGIRASANGSGKDIDAVNNTISGNLSGSVGSVSSGVTITTNNDKTGYRLSATGVDDVWDEVQSGHSTSGTFGKYLDSSISGVSTGGVSAATIAAAVWDESRSSHVTSGTFGQGVASVTGAVGSVTGAVGSVTGNVGGNVTGSVGSVVGNVGGNVAGSVGSVTGNVGGSVASVVGAVGSVTGSVGGNVTGSVGSFGSTAVSSIKTAVWDEATSSHTTSGTTGANMQPVYFADISFLKDDTDTKDEYTVTWFKNGAPILTGITSPSIRVLRRSDGSDIVSNTSLTEVSASTGIYKYDSTSSNRITVGDSFIIITTATIDGTTRTFRKVQGRDN